MARREFSAVCGRHLLVMHGKVGMKGDNLPGGTLLGSMLMSDRGAALAAPAQQLALAHGMLSSFAPGAAAQPDPAAALEARALAGRAAGPGAAGAHAGGGHLGALVGAHGTGRVLGGSQSGRPARDQDECPTNLNAVGKSVGYLPVGQPGDMPGLRPVAGGARRRWRSGPQAPRSGCRAGPANLRCDWCARA